MGSRVQTNSVTTTISQRTPAQEAGLRWSWDSKHSQDGMWACISVSTAASDEPSPNTATSDSPRIQFHKAEFNTSISSTLASGWDPILTLDRAVQPLAPNQAVRMGFSAFHPEAARWRRDPETSQEGNTLDPGHGQFQQGESRPGTSISTVLC